MRLDSLIVFAFPLLKSNASTFFALNIDIIMVVSSSYFKK